MVEYVRFMHNGENTGEKKPLQFQRGGAEILAIIAHITLISVSFRSDKVSGHPDILLLVIMSFITMGFHVAYIIGIIHWNNPSIDSTLFSYSGSSRNTLKWLESVILEYIPALLILYNSRVY